MEEQILKFIDENKLNYKNYNQIVDLICAKLDLSRGEVLRTFDTLFKEGLVVESSKKKVATAKKMGLVKGVVDGNNRGFAFVEPADNAAGPHIFVPAKRLNTAMHNDIVLVHLMESSRGDSLEGEVFKILKRGITTLVGRIELSNGYGFLVPDNNKFSQDVFIPKNRLLGAKNGEKVVVKITGYDKRRPEGQVIEVLGDASSPEVELLSIIRSYNLIEEFSSELLAYTAKMSQTIKEEDLAGRLDLRGETIITIDGDDAKDLDDAISIKYDENTQIYTLGVHIADVGNYVKRGTLIDGEAFNRGTSVYFPHAVLPMLPRELSNGICSLNQKVDRLTLSVIMDIDKSGKVVKHEIFESVIKSTERMTYDNVTKILEGDEELNKRYADISSDLKIMVELAKILETVRFKRGALDFDLPETKIVVDPKTYQILELKRQERKTSHRLIESFMLIANETVAQHMFDLKIPFVYRVHEKPSQEKLEAFNEYIAAFGLKIKEEKGEVTPKDLQDFLGRIEGLEYKDVINKVLLRSMQKAKYSPDCLGHYGLAATYYTHFTSPIRRYPDLTIHRIIKDYLHGKVDANYKARLQKFVEDASLQSSLTEVSAEKCERDIDDYFKAKYMEDKIGEEFDGTISGVTAFGIFVELDNTIEGFIRVQDLEGDGYNFNERMYSLSNTKYAYKMGDKIRVKVISANAVDKRVDFELV
ncbi:MAG: ribonuclease R [Spirochaetales bacterium]